MHSIVSFHAVLFCVVRTQMYVMPIHPLQVLKETIMGYFFNGLSTYRFVVHGNCRPVEAYQQPWPAFLRLYSIMWLDLKGLHREGYEPV